MPQMVQTGQNGRVGCLWGAGTRRAGPGGRARHAVASAERSDRTLSGSTRTPIALRVWWSGGQAVTRSSGVPGYRGPGSAIACWPVGWGGSPGSSPWGSRHARMPGRRVERGFGRHKRGDQAGAISLTGSTRRGPRRSRGYANLATSSNNSITQSNISEFVRT